LLELFIFKLVLYGFYCNNYDIAFYAFFSLFLLEIILVVENYKFSKYIKDYSIKDYKKIYELNILLKSKIFYKLNIIMDL
jgi:hypothetical protein